MKNKYLMYEVVYELFDIIQTEEKGFLIHYFKSSNSSIIYSLEKLPH